MKSITSMLYKARAELGSWACVLFSWVVIWISALIKNQVDGTQVNELHSYLYLFVMSAVFFLCVIGAVILLNVVSRVSAERKIWFYSVSVYSLLRVSESHPDSGTVHSSCSGGDVPYQRYSTLHFGVE